ncbi:hypothetical protein BBP40_006918 [Aspergillus hancockii]|nr:hypothetical protein BBP40_006918 [Aspergillus hancockii]
MTFKHLVRQVALSLAICGTATGQKVNGADYNKSNGGPPGCFFATSSSLPVSDIQSAALKASVVPGYATHPGAQGPHHWAQFSEGAAYSWVADMDVDYDGPAYQCKGNLDDQGTTNWGALAAYEVVIPQRFLDHIGDALPGNQYCCCYLMYYGILDDATGDSPEVTGEASWLTTGPVSLVRRLRGKNPQSI